MPPSYHVLHLTSTNGAVLNANVHTESTRMPRTEVRWLVSHSAPYLRSAKYLATLLVHTAVTYMRFGRFHVSPPFSVRIDISVHLCEMSETERTVN